MDLEINLLHFSF